MGGLSLSAGIRDNAGMKGRVRTPVAATIAVVFSGAGPNEAVVESLTGPPAMVPVHPTNQRTHQFVRAVL